uniref:Uncharacterized protein n=1 Tax=Octopus bimaculoides TaxID=37653 RepID=A0A0L8FX32_OCTBM
MKHWVKGRSVPVKMVKWTTTGGEVRALRMTVIPLRLDRLLQCSVSGSFDGYLGMVELDRQCKMKAGVMVGQTLEETSSDEVLVVAANFSWETEDLQRTNCGTVRK